MSHFSKTNSSIDSESSSDQKNDVDDELFHHLLLNDVSVQQEALKLDNQLCFQLYAASKAVVRSYRPLLNELKLTYPQYLVMLLLWECSSQSDVQSLSVRQLGLKLHLDSGTLTPLLKRLEAVGYIDRLRDQEDARSVNVFLTQEGLDLYKKALNIPVQLLCQYNLPLEELLSLKQHLKHLLKQLENVD